MPILPWCGAATRAPQGSRSGTPSSEAQIIVPPSNVSDVHKILFDKCQNRSSDDTGDESCLEDVNDEGHLSSERGIPEHHKVNGITTSMHCARVVIHKHRNVNGYIC